VASRVEEWGALPEVEVEGWRRGLLVKEAVLRHVVEGMRSELMRELVGWVGV
jgi:hypothetical protein